MFANINEVHPLSVPFSVVTATLNSAQQLAATIASIRGQSCSNIDWIVIDGGSTDGTVDLIESNQDVIRYWVSEPDGGIYDAWNKACQHIQGEWVIFLGAGDRFCDPDVLQTARLLLQDSFPEYCLAYGNLRLLNAGTFEPVGVRGKPWNRMEGQWEYGKPMLPWNPEVFYHRSCFAHPAPFDASYRIAGDVKFMLLNLRRGPPLYLPLDIAAFVMDGTSANPKNFSIIGKEIARLCRELDICVPRIHRFKETAKRCGKQLIFRLVGNGAYFYIANRYRLGKQFVRRLLSSRPSRVKRDGEESTQ